MKILRSEDLGTNYLPQATFCSIICGAGPWISDKEDFCHTGAGSHSNKFSFEILITSKWMECKAFHHQRPFSVYYCLFFKIPLNFLFPLSVGFYTIIQNYMKADIILRYCNIPLYFCSAVFWRQILYFLLLSYTAVYIDIKHDAYILMHQ